MKFGAIYFNKCGVTITGQYDNGGNPQASCRNQDRLAMEFSAIQNYNEIWRYNV